MLADALAAPPGFSLISALVFNRNDEGLPPFGSLHRDSSVFAFHQ